MAGADRAAGLDGASHAPLGADHHHGTGGHEHGLGHAHGHAVSDHGFRAAVLLTAIILAVEVTGGLLAHSLALLADAGHVLTDVAALALAWFATRQAGRPADERKTYGYHRTGILAALANALTLIAIVVAIAYEAIGRLRHPQPVTPALMFAAAGVGLLINLYIARRLHGESQANLNVRAAFLHVLGDLGASAGVILAGLVILFTGWNAADPLLSLAIAALISYGAWGVVREAVGILMEAAPVGVDIRRLADDLAALPEVTEVHDLHVWSIAGGMNALSAHVLAADDCSLSDCDEMLGRVNRLLADRYQITHTTIQFEYGCCGRHNGDAVFCTHADQALAGGHCHHQRAEQADAVPAGPRT
jgi:cobalt-zinc-cadmium efflux system protein